MAQFKKSRTLKGTFKNVIISDNSLVDEESGEQIDLIKILSEVYGQNAFDISTSLKTDEDVNIDT